MNELETPQKSKRNGLLIGLILALLAGNLAQFYFSQQDQEEIEKKAVVIAQQSIDLQKANLELDSMRKELDTKIAEVLKLGGDTASLGELKRQIERDLKDARGKLRITRVAMDELRSRIERYEEIMERKDDEIAQIKQERDVLFKDNQKLKTKIVQREDSIENLKKTKSQLASQVALASVLKAEDVKVTIIDSKGKEREDDKYKAKRIAKIKVAFTISDNKVAKIETKDVYLQVRDEAGNVLYDVATGGGMFKNTAGDEMPFTSKLSFFFDNKTPNLSFVWDRGSEWKAGNYQVLVYCEGERIGQGSFIVR
jgi:cell division protein ZapB